MEKGKTKKANKLYVNENKTKLNKATSTKTKQYKLHTNETKWEKMERIHQLIYIILKTNAKQSFLNQTWKLFRGLANDH